MTTQLRTLVLKNKPVNYESIHGFMASFFLEEVNLQYVIDMVKEINLICSSISIIKIIYSDGSSYSKEKNLFLVVDSSMYDFSQIGDFQNDNS